MKRSAISFVFGESTFGTLTNRVLKQKNSEFLNMEDKMYKIQWADGTKAI